MAVRTYQAIIIASLAICIILTGSHVKAASTADIPESFLFEQTLRPNFSYDPDVKYLQLVLNSNNQTLVALTGPGSNDNPTNYYGNKTRDAVNRFQVLYKNEILVPAGLTEPTGIVGARTRTKLNALLKDMRSGQSADSPTPDNNTKGNNSSLQTNTPTTSNDSDITFDVVEDSSEVVDGTPETTTNSATTNTTSNTISNPANTNTSSAGTSNTAANNSTTNGTGGSPSTNNQSSGSGSGTSAAVSAGGAAVSAGASSLTSSGSSAGSTGGGTGATGGTQYFGGRITNVTYCTCSTSIMLDIQDNLRGYVSVIYMPGVSRLYSNYQVFSPGPNVIGGYTAGGTCLVYSGNSCNTQGSPMGTITAAPGIGTSLE